VTPRPLLGLYAARLRRRSVPDRCRRTSGSSPTATAAGPAGAGSPRPATVRAVLHDAADRSPAEVAATLAQADIERRLDTAGRPDPELIIRTSGEQRLSDFLLWQGVRSELWFCDAYWPAFREVDFLRALRGYTASARSTLRGR
jgi:hypothetical protein